MAKTILLGSAVLALLGAFLWPRPVEQFFLPGIEARIAGGDKSAEAQLLMFDAVVNVAAFYFICVVVATVFSRITYGFAGALLVGVSVEAAQLAIPERHPDVKDIVYCAIGAVIGAATLVVLEHITRHPGPSNTETALATGDHLQ
ncbi:MAG TPA: VanZ family protein [Naasia sp.]|jgi:glycopeptide antibiotics resistance protein